ncbi:MAG: DUF948 domain-containing protein [Nitrospirota bacterium]
MIGDIAVVVIAVTVVALVIYLIPTVIQIKNTAKSAERLFDELRETASQTNAISAEVRKGVSKAAGFMDAVEEIGATIKAVNSILKLNVIRVASAIVGIKTGFKVLFKGLKGGSSNE